MTILQIRTVPDPILRRKSRKIREVNDAIRELAQNMVATMHEAGGVGLAAPQVGQLKRLIVLQLPEEEDGVERVMQSPTVVSPHSWPFSLPRLRTEIFS